MARYSTFVLRLCNMQKKEILNMSSKEFFPGTEEGTNQRGELVSDVDKVFNISFIEDNQFSVDTVTRTEILDFENQGFLLKNILTQRECVSLIQEGESVGFKKIIGAQDNYRSAQRIVIESDALAEVLFRRIKPFIEDHALHINGTYKDLHVHSTPMFLLDGDWELSGLNSLFRLCRYKTGGHFAPHFDGFYQKSSQERSMKTLMLYLNGDFEGGSTNFVDESQALYKDSNGKYCAEEKNVLCKVQPECGMGILFNHHRLHEGEQLKSNVKYILRTDVMYQKVRESKREEKLEKGLSFLKEAERLEAQGKCMESMEFYRKAFKLCPELENS